MFKVEYLASVRDDLKEISKADRNRIQKAIETKLVLNPIEFGKPLQYSLKGLRRLRVGDHRVVFKIEEQTKVILIVKIGHRKEVYDD